MFHGHSLKSVTDAHRRKKPRLFRNCNSWPRGCKTSIPTSGPGLPQQWQLENWNLAGNSGAWERSCPYKPPSLLTRVTLQTHTTPSPFTAHCQPKGSQREVQSPAHHCCWESPSSATLVSGVGGCLFRSSSSCCRRTSSSSSWERKHFLFKNTAHFSRGVLESNNNSVCFSESLLKLKWMGIKLEGISL